MVRAYGVDLLDLVAERHRLVDDELQELVRRGLAREEFELLVDGPTPEEHDAEGELRRLGISEARRGRSESARTMMAPMGSSPGYE